MLSHSKASFMCALARLNQISQERLWTTDQVFTSNTYLLNSSWYNQEVVYWPVSQGAQTAVSWTTAIAVGPQLAMVLGGLGSCVATSAVCFGQQDFHLSLYFWSFHLPPLVMLVITIDWPYMVIGIVKACIICQTVVLFMYVIIFPKQTADHLMQTVSWFCHSTL